MMARRQPRAGVGSNQYQSKGQSVDRHRGPMDLGMLRALFDGGDEQDDVGPVMSETELAARMVSIWRNMHVPLDESLSNTARSEKVRDEMVAAAVHIAQMVQRAGLMPEPLTEEELIGWTFAHPEWAAAGFGPGDEREIELWAGDVRAAAEARRVGASWWDGDTNARIPSEWAAAGFTSISFKGWQDAGVTPDEAMDWLGKFDAGTAAQWRSAGFTPDEALAWNKVAPLPREAVEYASKWRAEGFTPQEVADWTGSGNSLREAVKARQRGATPKEAANLGPAGIPGKAWQTLGERVTEAGFVMSDPEHPQPRAQYWTATINDSDGHPVAVATFDSRGKFTGAEVYTATRGYVSSMYKAKSMIEVKRLLPSWSTKAARDRDQ